MLALLIVATIVDLLLAALLIAVSVLFGGELSAVTIWTAGLIACVAAPLVGFGLRAFSKPGTGVLVALLPPIIAALLSSGIVPGY
jgi:hypothetical protein